MKKKLLLTILIVVSVVSGYAQNKDHLMFRDIPIDGDLNSFVKKLEAIGYVKTYQHSNGVIMSGVFAGENCEVNVAVTPKTKIVCMVAAFTKEYNSWAYLLSTYKKFKGLYTDKYGDPTYVDESFSFPFEEGDGCELMALKDNKCSYICRWKADNGNLGCGLSERCGLMFVYRDKQNGAIYDKEESNAIGSDI